MSRSHWTGTAWYGCTYAVVHTLVPSGIFLSFLSYPSSLLSRPASGLWAYRSTFSQPCDPCVISEVFFSHHDDQRVSGGCFRGPLRSACGGSLVLIRRLLARWLPAWILLRYCLRSLRTRCLLRRSVQLLRCCNGEDLHRVPSATRVCSEAYWAGDASDLCTRCCSGSGNPLCWDDTRQHETCCRFSFQSVIKQDADIRDEMPVLALRTVGWISFRSVTKRYADTRKKLSATVHPRASRSVTLTTARIRTQLFLRKCHEM